MSDTNELVERLTGFANGTFHYKAYRGKAPDGVPQLRSDILALVADAKNWADIAERYRQAMMKAEALINSTPMPVAQDGRTSMLWKRISDAADVLRAARHGVIWGYDHASPAAFTAALGAQTPPERTVTEAQGWRDMASAPKSVGTHIRALIETEIVMEEHIPALLMGGWKRIAGADRLVGWLPTPPVNQSEGADRG